MGQVSNLPIFFEWSGIQNAELKALVEKRRDKNFVIWRAQQGLDFFISNLRSHYSVKRRLIMSLAKKVAAEFFGTFWLVFAGCGSAVLATAFPELGIGWVGVALAFGFAALTMIYAVGHISGGHFNPAVAMGLAMARRLPFADAMEYIIAQVLGAIAGAGALYLIASGKAGFSLANGFASNGYAEHSPSGYSMIAGFIAEVILTFFFLLIILGSTDTRAPQGFAPIAIGLALTVANLVAIPVTNASINPARSTGPALFAGGWAISQLWLFWVAPVIGGVLAGVIYPILSGEARLAPRGRFVEGSAT